MSCVQWESQGNFRFYAAWFLVFVVLVVVFIGSDVIVFIKLIAEIEQQKTQAVRQTTSQVSQSQKKTKAHAEMIFQTVPRKHPSQFTIS